MLKSAYKILREEFPEYEINNEEDEHKLNYINFDVDANLTISALRKEIKAQYPEVTVSKVSNGNNE